MDTSNYKIAICELFNPKMHGITVNSSSDIDGQFLVHTTFNVEEFVENEWISILDMMKAQYASYPPSFKRHNLIRNYKNIIDDNNYFKLDIVKMIEMNGGECVGIIKTTGLKRLQKLYKRKIYEKNHY